MSFPWPLVRSSLQPLDGFSTERFGIKLEAASFSREKFLHVACVSATLPLQQGSLTRIFFMADGSTGTPSLLLSIRGRGNAERIRYDLFGPAGLSPWRGGRSYNETSQLLGDLWREGGELAPHIREATDDESTRFLRDYLTPARWAEGLSNDRRASHRTVRDVLRAKRKHVAPHGLSGEAREKAALLFWGFEERRIPGRTPTQLLS